MAERKQDGLFFDRVKGARICVLSRSLYNEYHLRRRKIKIGKEIL